MDLQDSIQVQANATLFFLFGTLEFLFIIPVWLHARKKGTTLKKHLSEMLWKGEMRSTQAFMLAASIAIAFLMLLLAPTIIQALDTVIIFFFQEEGLQQARDGANYVTVSDFSGPGDVILVVIVQFAFVAFNEELFFRGFLVDVIHLPPAARLLISSGCFALYHVVSSFNLFTIMHITVYYFTWGIVLVFQRWMGKGQLLFPIITHGLFNVLLMCS